MANFAATDSVTICNSVEVAAAALETALETIENTSVIRLCDIIRLPNNDYAAVIVYTAAV
jgi:hypothetical protein